MNDLKHDTDILTDIPNEKNNGSLSANNLSDKINLLRSYSDSKLQAYLLEKVSRTFALTIPALPSELSYVVSNAYLLCRIVDTVEDEPNLSIAQEKEFCKRFVDVVAGKQSAEKFGRDLFPHLSDETTKSEKELIILTDRVIGITHQFNQKQQAAMKRCVEIMADGMVAYQQKTSPKGLQNIEELNDYCYYVAGVVGEMLTDLFCVYSPEIAEHRDEMMNLAVSFGQGLQMTNILKDVWRDYNRSVCWLPRDHFKNELKNLEQGKSTPDFQEGMVELVGVTHDHLQDAMNYILFIPPEEKGIRSFCYWAVGMAVLTLQKIYRNPGFTDGDQVKISRRSVKMTVLMTKLTIGNNYMLKKLFDISRWGLPVQKK